MENYQTVYQMEESMPHLLTVFQPPFERGEHGPHFQAVDVFFLPGPPPSGNDLPAP